MTPDMRGATVLVTGGTGGIGLASATGLAGFGARVGIVGRSAARGAIAADAVRREVPSARVDVFEADLSSQAGVRRHLTPAWCAPPSPTRTAVGGCGCCCRW